MPIYEFSCTKCGRDFEKLVSGSQQPKCPYCGSGETRKKVTACARLPRTGAEASSYSASTGCGGCSGGNCASCSR